MTTRKLALSAALVAVAAFAGFAFYESTQGAPAARQNAPAAMAPFNEPAKAPQLRPVFSLPDIDGVERSITEWDGKALVVNFWATWCAPCLREIPVLISMQEKLASQNIQFVGIAIDDPAAVSKFAEQTTFNYPILVGEQSGIDAAEAFGAEVVALPMTVFTDHAGNVIDIHAGEISRKEIKAILKNLPQ